MLHRTIKGVAGDYTGLRFNTGIAKLIELNNALTKLGTTPREIVEPLVLMVAPVAPHLSEELWRALGHEESLAFAPFPQADPTQLVEGTVTCVVQVQGKVRHRFEVPADITEQDLQQKAMRAERVTEVLQGKTVRKVIVRAPSLINIVAS